MRKTNLRSLTRGVALPLGSLMVIALSLAPAGRAADLPAGKGRETFQSICTSCHEADVSTQLRNTRSGWADIIRSMKEMGAEATPAQFSEIIDYLTEHFGKDSSGKGASQEKGAAVGATSSAAEMETVRPRRALPWDRTPLKIGQALYRENCVVCHDIDGVQSKKSGPSFHHLFQREKMPLANMKPSRTFVAAKVRVGGKLMPAFGKKLTANEISALIDYMQSK